MANGIDVDALVGRPESESTLVRFEDETDKHAPRLNYAVPLPGSYEGRFYIEVELTGLPWIDNSRKGVNKASERLTEDDLVNLLDPEFMNLLGKMEAAVEKGWITEGGFGQPPLPPSPPDPSTQPVFNRVSNRSAEAFLRVGDHFISSSEIIHQASQGNALVVYPTFGGGIAHTYVKEAKGEDDANPRFIIVEHYRFSAHFGDYGAGRTIKTFSLWPGEETSLYIRSWRRTEERLKAASTIFDSFTQTAADEFENSLERENTYQSSYASTKEWKASGGFGVNLGIAKIGGGGGGGGSSKSTRESFAKSVSKVATHHASKASAQRDTTISTELETSESTEFETITERKVKNVNLSRVLNLVCRELNQEFITYLSLVDVSIAFANDRHVYEEVPLHDVDRLLNKYLKDAWDGNPPAGVNNNPRNHVKDLLLKQISEVWDFQGTKQAFLEEVDDLEVGKYWRVRRRTDPSKPNPFYSDGSVPVEGIILESTRQTLRTDGIIVDALLGHGVALDTYALATQQEVLLEKQLANRKMELALRLVDSGDDKKTQAFQTLFICCSDDVIKKMISELRNSGQ